jgi:dephospho-CoA kinase
MKIVGLTGGIGMGKSTAAAAFRREGVPVFDADATVHRLQARHGRAVPLIARAFPGTVGDGVLDRAALRAVVLSDRAELRRLEQILHPLVRAEQRRFLARARGGGAPLVVLDIPLLFETGGNRAVDHVVVVSAPASVQRARVRARRRMSDSQIAAILAAQTPDAVKRAQADTIVLTGLSRFYAQRCIRRFLARERLQKKGWGGAPPPQAPVFF